MRSKRGDFKILVENGPLGATFNAVVVVGQGAHYESTYNVVVGVVSLFFYSDCPRFKLLR